ncbi:hypothetical protein CA12_14560 [Alienimonas californiensis]|uniref:Uncharacterized protein n=2 Tax=Alienimonas californiensis TaxID=2527989 RepID=A0A517P7L3_9PLAN|nr:hypothetical protein CA12_14560 [Alienimonas californiensis]
MIATVAASALGVVLLFVYARHLRHTLGIGDEAMSHVRVGLTEAEIAGPLAGAGFERHESPAFSTIMAAAPPGEPTPVIAFEWRKRVDTFFLPVTWVVSLDDSGTVIQTHRYD